MTSFGFSISFGYGLIYSFVVIVTGFVFMLLNVQRLRDMGYRYPVVVSLLLIIFSQFSDFLDDLVKMNFISLFIDMGLLVFFIIMLSTESKNRQHINYLRKQRQKGKVKMSNRFFTPVIFFPVC